ncbi:MAG: cache domain-containing protein, partial [Gammaproteobacteria bacterium]|nr:cache domain-containing protein [Gammaproteobacteria bacterium]
MRLQNKILTLLVPLIVLPILALGWTAYALLMDDARDRTQDQAATLLEQIRLHNESQLQTARANASLFASTELVMKYVTTFSASKRALIEQQVYDLLLNYQLAYPEYTEIRILSADGKELLRSVIGDIDNVTTDEAENPWFREVQDSGGAIHTAFMNNPDTGKPALYTSKPLMFLRSGSKDKLNDRKLYGYLVLTIDPGYLGKQSRDLRVGQNGDVFFTDSTGKILFHPDSFRAGKQVDPALFARLQDAAVNRTQVDARYNDEAGHYQTIKLDNWLHAVA